MHNAHYAVKSKRISIACKMHVMSYDDRPEEAKRLEEARKARNFATAKDASRYFGWKYETYIQHEQGIRGLSRAADKYAKAFRVSKGWLLTGEGSGPTGGRDYSLPETIRKKFEVLEQDDIDDLFDSLEALADKKINKRSARDS